MSYAIISDIHGNLQAMEAVLADIESRGIDKIYCIGDIVGYGADPHACIDIVRERGIPCVMGNHDFAVSAETEGEVAKRLLDFNPKANEAALWTRKQLNKEQRQFLRGLPFRRDIPISAGHYPPIVLVHSNIAKPENFDYINFGTFEEDGAWGLLDLSVDANFEMLQEKQILFVGHSHTPAAAAKKEYTTFFRDKTRQRLLGDTDIFGPKDKIRVPKYTKVIVDVGSVGQPRDGNNRACYVIFDDSDMGIYFVRVGYDIKEAARRIREAWLPDFLAERLHRGV